MLSLRPDSIIVIAYFLAFSNIIYISKLQRVQNAAARLITNTRKYDHITPALYNLHWLPVFYRIYFKILIVAFKAIYNKLPSYISNLVSITSRVLFIPLDRILHYFWTVPRGACYLH